MQCPNCGGDTSVVETRAAGRHEVRRRRVCGACKLRFTTREQVEAPRLRVDKRRGGTEPYERAKLRTALARVCKHRPVSDEVLEDVLERIEAQLVRTQARTVRWSQLVELVLDALAPVDRVAARRMEANYLDEAGVRRLADAPPPGPRPQLDLPGVDADDGPGRSGDLG